MGRKERSGPPDEKVTINLGPVDVGRVDFLVEEGFFQSRTDFIRTAVRKLLDEHKEPIEKAATARSIGVGVLMWDRAALVYHRDRNEKMTAHIIGVFRLADDIDPDLADEVIESIRVYGHLSAPAAVRKRLAPKINKKGRV